MKNNLKNWRSLVAMVGIIVGLAIVSVPRASAYDPTPGVVPPAENVFGRPYGGWAVAWWQWVLSIPESTNPLNDKTGDNCAVGQSSGPVFFLVNSLVGSVERSCTVPRGKAIFFPIINAECSTTGSSLFHGDNEVELRSCAGEFGDAIDVKSLKVTVDGEELYDLQDHRAQSSIFNFTLPDDDVFDEDATVGSSVSDGYYVWLKPLQPGIHTIHFEGACAVGSLCEGFLSQNVTYIITVPNTTP
jgi:hypothetical protein